jgi:hypothetical protein
MSRAAAAEVQRQAARRRGDTDAERAAELELERLWSAWRQLAADGSGRGAAQEALRDARAAEAADA